MSVTAFVIGDPHFKVSNASETSEASSKLLLEIDARKPDFIVCLGDTLDRHANIHVYPLCQAVSFLRALSQIAPLYLLIGNHDRPNNSDFLSPYSPFSALHYWENTVVVDKVVVSTIKGFKFTFVPYVQEGRFFDALRTVPDSLDGVRAVFAHQEIRGVKMGSVVSINGDKWPSEAPLLISGHIHDYSELAKNVIYVGALMQQSHGEKYDKTVSLFTFQSESFSHSKISLGLKEKLTIRLPCSALQDYNPPDNVILRLILVGNAGEIRASINSDAVQQLKRKGVKVVSEVIEAEKVEIIAEETRVPFRDRLHEVTRNCDSMRDLYQEIFGTSAQ